MDERGVFVLADRELERVVATVRDDQWSMVMPPEFATLSSGPDPLTLHRVIGYHAYDDAWVPDMVAGRTMAQVGEDAFRGDLLGQDPRGAFSQLVERACSAVEGLGEQDLERTVHCSFGDFTAREYLWQVTMFRGLRAHDIAAVIGADADLLDALVSGMWDEIAPHAEEWRALGIFPAAVTVPDDAPLQDRLLGLTGRRP